MKEESRNNNSMKYFLDIGTHYGEGLLEFNKILGLENGWIVHCYEPNPTTNTALGIASVTSGWTSQVFLHKKAVWNKSEKINFLCSKRDPGELNDHYTSRWPTCYSDQLTRNNELLDGVSSHIVGVRQDTWGGEVQEIEAISAFDILENLHLSPEDEVYVKIDAEGAEKEILSSFVLSSFSKCIKKVYCEVHEGLATNGLTVEEINKICNTNGIEFARWW